MIGICQGALCAEQAWTEGKEECRRLMSLALGSLDTVPKRSRDLKQNYGCLVTHALSPFLHGHHKKLTTTSP